MILPSKTLLSDSKTCLSIFRLTSTDNILINAFDEANIVPDMKNTVPHHAEGELVDLEQSNSSEGSGLFMLYKYSMLTFAQWFGLKQTRTYSCS